MAQTPAGSQTPRPYSIVIKGGHVIDPKNNINELMDVAIKGPVSAVNGQPSQDATIALISKSIDTAMALQVVNASGMYVTPGLIDVHAHVFYGPHPENYLSNGSISVLPDSYTFKTGVTTIVDAGGAGYKSFALFKKNIIDLSRTRVLSFLNIIGEGMRGGAFEQNLNDMDVQRAVDTALAYKQHIVGFKIAHFTAPDWTPIQRITEAGRKANMPVMIDFGGGKLSIEELFTKYLRPGDIYTHVYTELPLRDPVVDFQTRQLRPFVLPAQKKGILFDVGFGSGSFNFRQAIPSIKAGFYPNTMGTDLHSDSVLGSMKDEVNMMSIFLAMGMDIPAIIKAASWGSAQAIKREDLGNLSVGGIADLAILNMRQGKFGFRDIAGNRQDGTQKFECEMTIKGGRIVYDLNAIATPVRK
ncbi:MAG: amidohydrolase/deacetylase family metallohydrolase [Bacteroidota bacterium]